MMTRPTSATDSGVPLQFDAETELLDLQDAAYVARVFFESLKSGPNETTPRDIDVAVGIAYALQERVDRFAEGWERARR